MMLQLPLTVPEDEALPTASEALFERARRCVDRRGIRVCQHPAGSALASETATTDGKPQADRDA